MKWVGETYVRTNLSHAASGSEDETNKVDNHDKPAVRRHVLHTQFNIDFFRGRLHKQRREAGVITLEEAVNLMHKNEQYEAWIEGQEACIR